MTKREIEKRKEFLLKQLMKEKEKIKEAEANIASFEYEKTDSNPNKESVSKPNEQKKSLEKVVTKKSSTKKKRKSSSKKPKSIKSIESSKKSTLPPPLPSLTKKEEKETKKHIIVPLKDYSVFDFEQRKSDWHKKSGINKKQVVCSECKDDDNWETILLENGKHLCYYCWIKNPNSKKNNQSTKSIAPSALTTKEEFKENNEKQKPKKIDQKLDEKALVKVEEENKNKEVGWKFYTISIILGVLLIALIVILMLGIISGNFDFNFNK